MGKIQKYKNGKFTHDFLVERGIRWVNTLSTSRRMRWGKEVKLREKGYRMDGVLIGNFRMEFDKYYESNVDREDDLIIIIEAKTLNANIEEICKYSPIGNFHWAIVEENTDISAIPKFWGVLIQKRNGTKEIRKPKYFPIDKQKLYEMSYYILRYSYNIKF